MRQLLNCLRHLVEKLEPFLNTQLMRLCLNNVPAERVRNRNLNRNLKREADDRAGRRIEEMYENAGFTRFARKGWATQLVASLLAASLLVAGASWGEEAAPATTIDAESGEPETDAESTEATPESEREVIYDRVMIIGTSEAAKRVPGSGHVIDLDELEKQQYSDVQRILRQVPGINIQEEDGFGLRPNIGIRGTGVERSSKVTLMEDGVLIAPAPYSAPSAYYNPTAGRMETVEVRKGSAAIRQGPHTNGGVINFVSTSIPGESSGRLRLSAGEHGLAKLEGRYGASWESFGFLVETFQQQADGFKNLDGGGDTGFELEDYMVKARVNSSADARIYQELEIKLGRTEQDGDETYLGLTAADFASDPYRRYRGSQNDNITSDHEQVQLRHYIRPSDHFDITTTFYRNDFFRNWYKTESTLGTSNGSILSNPEAFATELQVLRGEIDSVDDAVLLRNNRRDYYSQGIQSVLGFDLATGDTLHELQVGVRWHEDEEDRFQEDDRFAMRGGDLVLTTAGAPGSQSNRIGEAESLALFVEDRISLGDLTLTPGLRYESIDTRRLDFGRSDPQRTGADLGIRNNSIDVFIPGFGIDYQLDADWSLFGSLHRGFSPPSPSSTEEVDAEKSVNYEAGIRFERARARFEAVAFFNDYSNLLGTDTLSGGGTGTGDQFNGGEAEIQGLEIGFSTELYRGSSFQVPLRGAYTYTSTEFSTSFETSFADWQPLVERGDELPFVPDHQVFAEIGFEAQGWNVFLSANWVDETRTRAGQGTIPESESLDSRLVLDLGSRVTFAKRYSVFLQVRNLTDEVYVAARRPYGLRPGLPRTAVAGFSVEF